MSKTIRTRFAPSPTGFMHVGSVRTALFTWLYARNQAGEFVLRIEDTDQSREVVGSIDHIVASLDWLGLDRNEGPVAGGEYGPYLQSQRLELYRSYAQQLLDLGRAYVDPYTPDEVAGFRQAAQAARQPFLYRNHRPENLKNPKDWYGKKTIRFKSGEHERISWHDEVRGELLAGQESIDDFVLIKADGYPTYNFAHVIDDHEMQISHVFRGEEFLPSVPKFLDLHEALDIEPPVFVTVPPILNMNGGKKLSKRDGAKDVLEYREAGYMREAIVNFLALLGWNDGTEREIYTPHELQEAFSIDRIQRSGAKFDETKLDWIAWQHSLRQIEENATDYLQSIGIKEEHVNPDYARLAATKSRSDEDFAAQYAIYTDSPSISLSDFDLSQVDKELEESSARQYVLAALETLTKLESFTPEEVEKVLRESMAQQQASPRQFLNLVRWALTDSKVSPNLFEMIALLGREESTKRLQRALQ